MRRLTGVAVVLAAIVVAAPASAIDRYGAVAGGGRGVASDPDKRLERLAAASTPASGGRGQPSRSARSILKDDPYLRAAFAWIDNK